MAKVGIKRFGGRGSGDGGKLLAEIKNILSLHPQRGISSAG